MLAVTFPGCAAGTKLGSGPFNRERSEFGTFECLLWQARNSLPGADLLRRFDKLAIPCVGQIFASLIIKNFQGQRFELVFEWLTEKSQNFCFERHNHCPIILTRTRFRRLPSNSP